MYHNYIIILRIKEDVYFFEHNTFLYDSKIAFDTDYKYYISLLSFNGMAVTFGLHITKNEVENTGCSVFNLTNLTAPVPA